MRTPFTPGRARLHKGTGYRVLRFPEHPNADVGGMLYEHTMVMAETLGRPLEAGESAHHKNGVKTDNHPENLELWVHGVGSQPKGSRVADLVEFAVAILRDHQPHLLAEVSR